MSTEANNKLYVRQISFSADSNALEQFFATVGEVKSAKVITEPGTGRSRGFGFVEMATPELAQEAIQQLNGKELMGRPITVEVARPREDRPRGGGFGGGGGGGRGGGRGGFGGGGGRGGGRGGFGGGDRGEY